MIKNGIPQLASIVIVLLCLTALFGPTDALSSEAAIQPLTAAASESAGDSAPTNVKVGMFVTQLGDFDMAKRTYTITFWAWFLHDNPSFDPHATVEIVNARTDNVKFSSLDMSKGVRWHQEKHLAVLTEDWDITYFPFDRQVLRIMLEDGEQDIDHIRFIADSANSSIDPSVNVPGWTIENFNIAANERIYTTNYGDPTLQNSSKYAQVLATITVKRNGVRLLCSMFVGFAVAFLLAMLSFFLDFSEMAGTRVGLCAAAVFAAVGNKYALDNVLPPSASFTLSDVIVASSFAAILMAALAVVFIQALHVHHRALARTINAAMAIVTAVGVMAVNAIVILRAAA